MEEQDKNRPLRSVGNKVKDLYNTYVRAEEQSGGERNSVEHMEHSHHQHPEEHAATVSDDTLQRLQQAERERDELKDMLLRKTAEFENFRRRSQKEKQDLIEYANEHLILKMLPVVDDLHTAVEAARKSNDYAGMLKGIEMIYTKALKIFEDAGVAPIQTGPGEPFNVEIHEALAHIPSEAPEGHIVQEIQRGFRLREKVIRHTKVVTSAGSPD